MMNNSKLISKIIAFCLAFFIPALLGAQIPAGRIHHWSLNESGTTFVDDMGGLNASCVSASCPSSVTGRVSNALDFDGQHDSLFTNANQIPNPRKGITVMAWINPDSVTGSYDKGIVYKESVFFFEVESTTGYIDWTVRAGTPTVQYELQATGSITPGEWVHFAGTYDGSTLKVYQNGIYVEELAANPGGIINNYIRPYIIGYSFLNISEGKRRYFDGRIDEVAIYNRALSDAEIMRAYTMGVEEIPMPVQPSPLTATLTYEGVKLFWTSKNQVNSLGFELRRADEENGPYEAVASYIENPELSSTTLRHEYGYLDNDVVNGQTYWYKLYDVDDNGNRTEHGLVSITVNLDGLMSISGNIPDEFKLYQNYPNPFNPGTTLEFDVPYLRNVPVEGRLTIYNSLGQVVKVLYAGKLNPGKFSKQWDGRTEQNNAAPAGIYFARLIAGNSGQTIKMTLVK